MSWFKNRHNYCHTHFIVYRFVLAIFWSDTQFWPDNDVNNNYYVIILMLIVWLLSIYKLFYHQFEYLMMLDCVWMLVTVGGDVFSCKCNYSNVN